MSNVKTSRQVLDGMRGDVDKTDQPGRNPSACEAYGCPCAATVDAGSGWQCSWHWGESSDRWQAVTQALREHQWLIDHISTMQRMHSKGDRQCATMALEFWAQHPEQQPNEHEQRSINAYIGRMRSELKYRVGGLAKPPQRTKPQRDWPEFKKILPPMRDTVSS